jgi:hypothetical protein
MIALLTYLSSNVRNGEERATSIQINSKNKIEIILLFNILEELFEITTLLSLLWQSKNLDLASALNMAQLTTEILHSKGNVDANLKVI